jgi:hypothetical protein
MGAERAEPHRERGEHGAGGGQPPAHAWWMALVTW